MPRTIERYGWIPQLPDFRDVPYAPDPEVATNLPAKVDLRTTPHMPPVYDQGQLGSCTGNGWAGAYAYAWHLTHNAMIQPSRLDIYYGERVIEHTVGTDSGAQVRDGAKVLAKSGVCPEADWPYDIATFARPPSKKDKADALLHLALTYKAVAQDLHSLQAALASGLPVVFGFTVYDDFESEQVAQTGIVNMPTRGESIVGGHCVVLVGYDTASQRFIARNSWGTDWGQGGYFTIPFAYVTSSKLASDFWVLETTS